MNAKATFHWLGPVATLLIVFLLASLSWAGSPAQVQIPVRPAAIPQSPALPPFFSLDPFSPFLAGASAADLFGLVGSTTPALELTAAALGLTAGHNVDALSDGTDWVDPLDPCPAYVDPVTGNIISTLYFWSVDRNSAGASDGAPIWPLCISFGGPVPPELPDDGAAGDIFAQLWANPATGIRLNIKLYDEEDLGLIGLPEPLDELDALQMRGDLETTGDDVPDTPVFFSVDTPTAGALGVSPADVLVLPAGSDPSGRTLYASEAELGLQPGDDIDGLCLTDTDTIFSNGGRLIISLTPSSPSLTGLDGTPGTGDDYSPADGFKVGTGDPFPGSGLQVPFLPAPFLSLLPTDNVDAFDCRLGDPGEFPPGITQVYLPLVVADLNPGDPTPTPTHPAPPTPTATTTPTQPAPPTPTATETPMATAIRR